MTKLNINGRTYKLKTDLAELSIEDVTNLSLIEMPDRLQRLIKNPNEKNVEAITETDIEVDFPNYYRCVIGTLSEIPRSIVNKITAEAITSIYKLVADIVIQLEGLDFEPIAPERYRVGMDFLSPLNAISTETLTIPGHGYTIDQVAQAQDVAAAGYSGLVYIPAIYQGWSERKVLEFKDRAKRKPFRMVIDFFFNIWQSWNLSGKDTRQRSREAVTGKKSQEAGCKGLSTKLHNRDMVVFLN